MIIEHILLGLSLLAGASYHYLQGADERKHKISVKAQQEQLFDCSKACGHEKMLEYQRIHGVCKCKP